MIDTCYGGDVRDGLRAFIAAGIRAQTCVTSPPYWGLRDYGTAQWEGGDAGCDHRKVSDAVAAVATSTLGGGKKTTGHLQEGFGSECNKCGARRIDAQIGIESTIAEYVATMVDVFRLVRDALADDGTLWLNLGDSYSGSGKGAWDNKDGGQKEVYIPDSDSPQTKIPKVQDGLKPKDLCGIPWRVAFALQQPYYAGRIKNEIDRVWLAAMIDGEGCLFIHKRKEGQSNGQGYERKNASFGAGMEVANTHLAIVERCLAITGVGSICQQTKGRNQTLYRWNVRSNECRWIVEEVYPHLVAKQHQARLLLGCPSSGERADAAHQGLILLHNGSPTDVDFAAPPSLFKPGYYLRSDVIWSKLNPMPESVTDRPTKAHEYLFLLSKQERYYYDAAAIAERSAQPFGIACETGQIKARQLGQAGGTLGTNQGSSIRNRRTVWTIATEPYAEAYFATFPTALVEPCILAGSRVGDVVLDPFLGSGTVAQVAQSLGRRWLGCELNPAYVAMQRQRAAQLGMALVA